ncbi:hypothetical protein NEFER03_1800 [Nematocida sp. LUAm3]|nr:hypothetical protein NEFER03_1800 [Nematocida sp. LUAm3]KAI5173893.1 hypothetical protein NEFER02_0360 [Nematocida sp. LUAm2]KAI5177362.1 hypothetical protein NEFER01_0637 [Nematocida sp. LUAm1]
MNACPEKKERNEEEYPLQWRDGEVLVTEESVFQIIRGIKDPEHDYTLEELQVVSLRDITIHRENEYSVVEILITPTIPHCSMVALIGLSLLYKLQRVLSTKYITRVTVKKGTYILEDEANAQLEDIERTYSAFINPIINETLIALIEGVYRNT